jgi:AcrR family transcriptional regulator
LIFGGARANTDQLVIPLTGRSSQIVYQRPKLLSELRVQEVQEAALRVISRKGLAAATMREIADEAGIAKGTIYLYFKDRDDLLERTADFAFSKLGAELEATLPAIRDFPEKLTALIRTEVNFFDEHREFFRIYIALKNSPSEMHQTARRRRMCHPRYAVHLARLENMLRDAMERGEVRTADPARLALLVSESAVSLMLRRLTEDPPPKAEEDVSWLVDTLLHGLSARSLNRRQTLKA